MSEINVVFNLSGTDNRFADAVALADNHLLGNKQLFVGYLTAEVTSRHHDAINLIQNFIETGHKHTIIIAFYCFCFIWVPKNISFAKVNLLF